MSNTIIDSLRIKSQQLETAEKQFKRIEAERAQLLSDVAVLKRAIEINNELPDIKNVDLQVKPKTDVAEQTRKRKRDVVAALQESGRELNANDVGNIIGVKKMAAKAWFDYQIKHGKSKCPFEHGKNKSWIKLKEVPNILAY